MTGRRQADSRVRRHRRFRWRDSKRSPGLLPRTAATVRQHRWPARRRKVPAASDFGRRRQNSVAAWGATRSSRRCARPASRPASARGKNTVGSSRPKLWGLPIPRRRATPRARRKPGKPGVRSMFPPGRQFRRRLPKVAVGGRHRPADHRPRTAKDRSPREVPADNRSRRPFPRQGKRRLGSGHRSARHSARRPGQSVTAAQAPRPPSFAEAETRLARDRRRLHTSRHRRGRPPWNRNAADSAGPRRRGVVRPNSAK